MATCLEEKEQKKYMEDCLILEVESFFENFEEFFKKREELLVERLKKKLIF